MVVWRITVHKWEDLRATEVFNLTFDQFINGSMHISHANHHSKVARARQCENDDGSLGHKPTVRIRQNNANSWLSDFGKYGAVAKRQLLGWKRADTGELLWLTKDSWPYYRHPDRYTCPHAADQCKPMPQSSMSSKLLMNYPRQPNQEKQ